MYVLELKEDVPEVGVPGDRIVLQPGYAEWSLALVHPLPPNYGKIAGLLANDVLVFLKGSQGSEEECRAFLDACRGSMHPGPDPTDRRENAPDNGRPKSTSRVIPIQAYFPRACRDCGEEFKPERSWKTVVCCPKCRGGRRKRRGDHEPA